MKHLEEQQKSLHNLIPPSLKNNYNEAYIVEKQKVICPEDFPIEENFLILTMR